MQLLKRITKPLKLCYIVLRKKINAALKRTTHILKLCYIIRRTKFIATHAKHPIVRQVNTALHLSSALHYNQTKPRWLPAAKLPALALAHG